MRYAIPLILVTALSGCFVGATGQTAVLDRLDPLMTAHAAALAGDDVALMRSTGRAVIATYDAGVGPQ